MFVYEESYYSLYLEVKINKCEILMVTNTQCCGSVMFEFGFGSDRGKVLFPVPDPNPDHI